MNRYLRGARYTCGLKCDHVWTVWPHELAEHRFRNERDREAVLDLGRFTFTKVLLVSLSVLPKESQSGLRDRANSPQRILEAPALRTPFFRALIVNLAGAAIPNPKSSRNIFIHAHGKKCFEGPRASVASVGHDA